MDVVEHLTHGRASLLGPHMASPSTESNSSEQEHIVQVPSEVPAKTILSLLSFWANQVSSNLSWIPLNYDSGIKKYLEEKKWQRRKPPNSVINSSFFSFSFLKFCLLGLFLLLCERVWACSCTQHISISYVCRYHRTPEETVWSSGAGVTGGCEPVNMGARNETRVLWRNSTCF